MTPTPTSTPTAILGFIAQGDPLGSFLFNLGKALLILLVALILAQSAKRWIVHLMMRSKRINVNVASLVGNLAQITIVALGVINLLTAFGVDLASLITVLGVAGLAISLSLQDLLRNVVAGIYVLLEQPFKIGDRITVKDVTGVVQAIELRTTLLRTDDGLRVVVPNGTVLNEIVTNRSVSNQQKTSVKVRIAMASMGDLQKTSNEIISMLQNVEGVSETPAPSVAVEGTLDELVLLRVDFWFTSGEKILSAGRVVEALRTRWPEANITVLA
ncbi:MAG TPA: mechanosensitive ion channel domain-containing protein [Chloroflexia bacterium]|nr:mechanosensitive ion channel domain-containing protein [Chloroflexia bacterium]